MTGHMRVEQVAKCRGILIMTAARVASDISPIRDHGDLYTAEERQDVVRIAKLLAEAARLAEGLNASLRPRVEASGVVYQ